MKETINKLAMLPGDYWVSSFGLKVENTSPDMVIEVVLPTDAVIYPLKVAHQSTE